MGVVLLACRLGLAAMFLLAAIGKLVDLAGSRRALEAFSVPRRLRGPFAIGLPLVELAIGLALIPTATAAWAALAAVVLLSVLTVGLVRATRGGVDAECHCFGQLASKPIGWWTVARNGVLLALAAFVAVAGWDDAGTSATAWIAELSTLEAALVGGIVMSFAVSLATAVFAWRLLRRNGQLLLRLDAQEEELSAGGSGLEVPYLAPELAPGTPAPAFTVSGVAGEPISLDALLAAGQTVALLFTDPDCGACEGALAEAAAIVHTGDGAMTVGIVSRGSAERMSEKAAALGLAHVAHDPDDSVFAAFRMRPVPSAQLIDADGRIASHRAIGADAVEDLIANAGAAARAPVPDLKVIRR